MVLLVSFAVLIFRYDPEEETDNEELGCTQETALAFIMAVTALSFPEIIMLRKVFKIKLLAVFAGIMTIADAAVAYLFNPIM